jgi:hypothetical protein
MNMQKHYVLAALTPTAYAAVSSQMNMNHAVPMYRASDVDARIAELEREIEERKSCPACGDLCDIHSGLMER